MTEFEPGQLVKCKIISAGPEGYAVEIIEGKLPGLLPTENTLTIGEEIDAIFVCVHKDRIVVTHRFPADRHRPVDDPFFEPHRFSLLRNYHGEVRMFFPCGFVGGGICIPYPDKCETNET